MILVTGGTGLVGSHLLFSIVNADKKVKAIYRNKDRISLVRKVFSYYSEEPDLLLNKIDWINCDINDIPTLEIAFKDITHVYHCAALISFNPKETKKLFKVNVSGTTNIVNLCIAHSIKKLCYVSSIATIGNTINDEHVNETAELNDAPNVYAQSKKQGEMEVWRGSQEGVEVVIVNPGVIIGPGFWNNGSGTLFKRISKGLYFYPPSGTGFVSVNDVVRLMVNLMNSTIVNENYILVSKNISYKEAFTKIANALNKKLPKIALKKWMLAALWRLDWIKSNLLGTKRILSKKMAQSFYTHTIYSNEKIKKDISFEFENIETSIQFCASIFLEENH